MKYKYSNRYKIMGMINDIREKIANTTVLKNLCICLGLSLSILATSAGFPIVNDLYTEEVYAATQFSDDSNIRAYSREAVESLVKSGGIKGYPDGSFKPSGTITRIEYLSMAMNAVDPSGSARNKVIDELKNTDADYGDVKWSSGYEELRDAAAADIADVWGGKAQDLIIISGYIRAGSYNRKFIDGRSAWLQPITRAESAKMLVACLEELGGEKLEIKDNVEAIIADYKIGLSPEADENGYNTVLSTKQCESIEKLYSAGIVEGNEQGAFQPQYNLTREQAAQIIYRAVNKDKRANVVIPEKEVAPLPDNTTLNADDPNRRTAIAGDKFIASDGKTYDVVEQAGGILMSETPIAMDEGRYMSLSKKYVKDGAFSDGSLDGIKRSSYYHINPETGQGMWDYQWEALIDYYSTLLPEGKNGDIVHFGLGNWCTYEYVGIQWVIDRPAWLQ